MCTRNLHNIAELLLLTFFCCCFVFCNSFVAQVLLIQQSYLQAVDKKQAEFFFIIFLQDPAVLYPGQVILHIIFHFTEATGEKKHSLTTTAMLVATACILNHDQTTS